MTDFRALCAEMANELDHYYIGIQGHDRSHPLAVEARAALAQPEPQEPTVMEIIALADEVEKEGLGQVDLVRRALTRWGRLAKPEVQDQVLARVEFAEREFNCPSDVVLRQYCDDWFYGDPGRGEVDPVDLCRGAIKLFAQIPAPVPVSEGLPEPEDCNAEGCCWAIGERGDWMCVHVLGRSWSNPVYTHWLPHWALPVPNFDLITQGE